MPPRASTIRGTTWLRFLYHASWYSRPRAPVEGDVTLACLVVKGCGRRPPARGAAPAGYAGAAPEEARIWPSGGATTPRCYRRPLGAPRAGTGPWWGRLRAARAPWSHRSSRCPRRRGRAGPRLDYVRHMAFVILLVLSGLLFVAEDDLADGHGGERVAPRAVRRVWCRVECVANIAPRSARDVGRRRGSRAPRFYVWFLEKARTVP